MDYRWKIINGLICAAFVAVMYTPLVALAKGSSATTDGNGKRSYIVILEDMPLAAYDGRAMRTPERSHSSTRMSATSNRFTGARKLDVRTQASRKYLKFLDERYDSVHGEALLRLGRQLKPTHRYRHALNGFAVSLDEQERQALRELPGVKAIIPDEIQHIQTDSGPGWIGADKVHDGSPGFDASGGEGTVIGIIDSGVDWDHPSFADPGEGIPPNNVNWDHENPYDTQLGLCSSAEVLCNDKLVGVYDFVEDDLSTDEIEEYNNGRDNSGHGTHVTSIAAGNPQFVNINEIPSRLSGVAPNANIISYRVCYIGDPSDSTDNGCQTSAILRAIEQAIEDKVDVVNYSIGTTVQDPWDEDSPNRAFLNLRAAGIFVATSAGNDGPNAGSLGSPANVPWITSVGDATHDRVFSVALENLSGGDTTPPPALIGASLTSTLDNQKIVHARDYGSARCVNESPEWGRFCGDNTGSSSPFAPNTFNGEIVVCERGGSSRVEKGKNLMLAGAGGYVLVNTEQWGEYTEVDHHCLPATNLGENDGDKLSVWLASGNNHRASLSDLLITHVPEAGDLLAWGSSRGPNPAPAEDILKPDVIAPGTIIIAAAVDGGFTDQSGTSMASPQVSGGAALIKSVHKDWSPAMIASALLMTATPELALDYDYSIATPHQRGAGRPQLDQAIYAGLYLDETEIGFLAANPELGGKPKDLNLPGLVDTVCRQSCSFKRTVTDLVGGASWRAAVEGLDEKISASVSPGVFSLANGASRELTINIDLSQADIIGTWVYGKVRLTSTGLPDAVFTLAVFADGGELPAEWEISSDDVSGWQKFTLEGLAPMPDAIYTSGGLVVPTETTETLPEDTTGDPYDGSPGVMTVWEYDVPDGALWLHAEILATTAEDVDLYVGRDSNGDGIAQESEELCASVSPTELDYCDLFTPEDGNYWIIAQNWAASQSFDVVTLETAVVAKTDFSGLVASGNGIVPLGEEHEIRLSWDNVNHVPGTKLIGAVGIGTHRETPNNIGIIPVRFTKTDVADAKTLVLMNGIARGLTIKGNDQHDHSYIDVPPGAASLTIVASATDGEQGENLEIELYRQEFDDAFTNAPFATVPPTGGTPLESDSGSGSSGPEVTRSGDNLIPGRWFVVLKNKRTANTAFEIKATVTFAGDAIPLRGGLWQPSSRPNIGQGYDFHRSGISRALIWYTYDEDGSPAFYVAADLEQEGNIWVSEVRRSTNDGLLQQSEKVGSVSVTTLAEQDEIFSFVLFGDEGSDRMFPNSDPICPTVNGVEQSYNGMWTRPNYGVGGSSALVNAISQGYLHYIYDDRGRPIWLLGNDASGTPNVREMVLWQLNGFCPVCTGDGPGLVDAGMLTRDFVDEDNMTWNLNYILNPPLSGSANRTDAAGKVTHRVTCQ